MNLFKIPDGERDIYCRQLCHSIQIYINVSLRNVCTICHDQWWNKMIKKSLRLSHAQLFLIYIFNYSCSNISLPINSSSSNINNQIMITYYNYQIFNDYNYK